MIGYLTLIIALAANIDVTEDIATSTTWTADNTYWTFGQSIFPVMMVSSLTLMTTAIGLPLLKVLSSLWMILGLATVGSSMTTLMKRRSPLAACVSSKRAFLLWLSMMIGTKVFVPV